MHKQIRQIAAAIAIMLTSAGAYAQTQIGKFKSDVSQETKDEVQRLNKQMEESFTQNDLLKIVEFYADDASIVLPGGKVLNGRKEVSEYFMSLQNRKELKLDVTEIGGSGKMIYEIGTAKITTVVDGKEKTETATFTIIFQRQSDFAYKVSVNSMN